MSRLTSRWSSLDSQLDRLFPLQDEVSEGAGLSPCRRPTLPAVAAPVIQAFSDGHLQQISKVLGEAASGTEITSLLRDARLGDPLGEGSTKWRRIHVSLAESQGRNRNANAACAFIARTMEPVRFSGDPERFAELREELNVRLLFAGLQLREDGRVARVTKAKTLADAEQRASALRARLRERNVHPDVLGFCRRELVQENYFHAVFEATKSVAEKIRARSGFVSDGATLVDEAFGASSGAPALVLNSLRTQTERSEQTGLMMLIKGMFSTFRNPGAHEPRISWPINFDDAMDLLTLVSMLHRRIDAAHVTPDAPAYKP
jgi:uncharacterized protein (TIGR02391 family)